MGSTLARPKTPGAKNPPRCQPRTRLGRRSNVNVPVAERTRVDLDAFVSTEYPKVVAAVGLITGNRQDAADAVQDAIVGFLAKPPSREITNVAAWITVVASNRARDIRRSRAAESRALAKVGVDDESVDAATDRSTSTSRLRSRSCRCSRDKCACSITCSTNPWKPSRKASG